MPADLANSAIRGINPPSTANLGRWTTDNHGSRVPMCCAVNEKEMGTSVGLTDRQVSSTSMKLIQTNILKIALALFTCLVLVGATASAHAGSIRAINGIDDGEVISGDVLVSARVTGNINKIYYRLSGPYSMTAQRSDRQGLMIDDQGNTVAWDTTTVPDGQYALYVYSLNNRGIDDMRSVSFRVDNNQGAVAPTTAPSTGAAEEVVVVEPTPQEPVVVDQTSVETVQEPAPTPTVAQDLRTVEAFEADFSNLAASYEVGSGQAIPLVVMGELAANEDLLVLAWSGAESRMVDEFAFRMTQGPWEIPADRLALLPAGRINLQLMVRQDGQIQSGVRRDVDFVVPQVTVQEPVVQEPVVDAPVVEEPVVQEPVVDAPVVDEPVVLEPVVVEEPQLVVDNFDIAFRDKPRAYQQGSGQSIRLSATGELPAGEELIVACWDYEKREVVDGFTFTLSEGPWVIPASKLDLLPANQVQLQLIRQGGDNLRVLFVTSILAPTQPVVQEPVVEEPVVQEPVVEEPVVDPTPATDPTAVLEPVVSFIDTPAQYVPGSGVAINFDVQNLPAGGDVLIMAWSDSQAAMVDGFSHYLTQGPWRISAAQMNLLPAGTIELQLIVRGGDTRPKTTHRLTVGQTATQPTTQDPTTVPTTPTTPTTDPTPQDPGTPDSTTDPVAPSDPVVPTAPDVVVDPVVDPAPDVQPAPAPDLGGTAIGFTPIVRFNNTRVVYVSSSRGDDANDGLTEQTPVRSLRRGQDLLRNGYPDHMLLRCGDVWDGEALPGFNKSGASADRPLVISTYGTGARPLIIPPTASHGIALNTDRVNGLVIQGLHIYAATRDPGSPRYINRDGSWDGIHVRLGGTDDGKFVRGLVIEDCVVTHFDTNIEVVDDWPNVQNMGVGVPGRLQCVIRRNIVRYASGSDSHSVGIYIEGSRDSVIEYNLIDHNGWAQTDGNSHRNKRSHNIYAQSMNGPIVVRGNILTRGAAHALQLRPGGSVENNLMVRNALGFFTTVNDSTVRYNVVLESEDMNPDIAVDYRGHGMQSWNMGRCEIVGNVFARRVGQLTRPAIEASANTLIVRDNRVYDWATREGVGIVASGGTLDFRGNMSVELFGGEEPPYVDPSRGVESYAATIGLEPTLEAFLDAVGSRPRGVWIDELSTDTVCRYIRNGFDLLPHD